MQSQKEYRIGARIHLPGIVPHDLNKKNEARTSNPFTPLIGDNSRNGVNGIQIEGTGVSHSCYAVYPGPVECKVYQGIWGTIRAKNIREVLEKIELFMTPLKADFLQISNVRETNPSYLSLIYEWNEGALFRNNFLAQRFKIIDPSSELYSLFANRMSGTRYEVIESLEETMERPKTSSR
jgi:hypothetical protein